MVIREATRLTGPERRLNELGIKLPAPPEPFGAYVEAVQTGNLLFLSGMLPTEGHEAKVTGRLGAELDVAAGRQAARLATLNVLAVARSIWDRSTESRGSFGSASRWPPSAPFAISPKSPMPPRSCCKTSSAKTKVHADWCMVSPAFRWARRWSWK
jgi:hypothetical protein